MSKVIFICDPHISDITPSSRRDDYPQAILNKFNELKKICEEQSIDYLVMEGDVFHRPSGLSLRWLNLFVDCFKSFPCPLYSIVGNHDIPWERLEEVQNTTLGLFFKTNVIHHLEELKFDDCVIKGYDYGQQEQNAPKDLFSICVSHIFYEDTLSEFIKPSEKLTSQQIQSLGYNAYVLGHDHSYHDPIQVGNSMIYRQGAFSRGSSHTSNRTRDIKALLFDSTDKSFKEVIVPSASAEEIYDPTVLLRDEKTIESQREYAKMTMDEILKNMDFSIGSSIYDVMDITPMSDEIRNLIESYLNSASVIRISRRSSDPVIEPVIEDKTQEKIEEKVQEQPQDESNLEELFSLFG